MSTSHPKAAIPARRIGLVLGGGGARGWAHVGVLRRLQALGVPIDCIAGTSAGAFVGAVFAAGRLDLLEDLAHHLDWKQAARIFLEVGIPPRSGLLTGRHVERFIREMLGAERFDELTLPFAAVAVNLMSQKEVHLSQGSAVMAIRASVSLPGIFTPVPHAGGLLIDGGVINPLPVNLARAMGATTVIAVDVNLQPGRGIVEHGATADTSAARQQKIKALLAVLHRHLPRIEQRLDHAMRRRTLHRASPTIFDVMTQSTRAVENQVTHARLLTDPPDILIQPAVGDIFTLEFNRALPAIAAGEAAVLAQQPALEKLSRQMQPPSCDRLGKEWGERRDLNPRPPDPQSGALTN